MLGRVEERTGFKAVDGGVEGSLLVRYHMFYGVTEEKTVLEVRDDVRDWLAKFELRDPWVEEEYRATGKGVSGKVTIGGVTSKYEDNESVRKVLQEQLDRLPQ